MSSGKTNPKKLLNTIRFRLTLWGAGITLVVCLLLCAILYMGLWISLMHEVDGVLEGEVQELTASVFQEHDHDYQAAEQSISLELAHRLRGDLSFRLLDDRGHVLVNSDPEQRLRGVQIPATDSSSNFSGGSFETITIPNSRTPVRVCTWLFEPENGQIYIVQVAYLLDRVTRSLTIFRWVCIAALFVVSIAALAGGRIIATRSLRPIQAMTAKANQISVKELDERLPRTDTGDELDHLAETLNKMLDRVQQYVTGLRQFTADASHEFRTPLAALRGNAEVALTRHRTEAELRQVIEESIEQYDRLGRIAEDLLLLARADAGHLHIKREKVSLDEAIDDVVDLYRPLAQDQDIELTFTDCNAIWLEADSSRLRQMIGNLIDNAIKYGGAKGKVTVALSSEDSTAQITVADNGPGLTPEQLSRVFDRFYRVDPSRSAQNPGGAGLGLAICRTIAEAHGGRIDISSAPGKGTSISVFIPVNAGT